MTVFIIFYAIITGIIALLTVLAVAYTASLSSEEITMLSLMAILAGIIWPITIIFIILSHLGGFINKKKWS